MREREIDPAAPTRTLRSRGAPEGPVAGDRIGRYVVERDHQDLREMFDDLNESLLRLEDRRRITWGLRTGRSRRRNSIKMRSYSVEDPLIRIHRAFAPPYSTSSTRRRSWPTRRASIASRRRARERKHLDALLTY